VPTHELAIQAFEVLRSFGGMHDLSAGLLIGGKNVKFEQERIRDMNILICTPGRLLQHMNESEGFDSSNLKCLVFDEVDRLLDMGFKETIDQIMRNLPKKIQVMLFSATIGKQLKDLARVKLGDKYEYICLHDFDSIESRANDYNSDGKATGDEDKALTEQLKSITPVKLLHYYMQVNIEDKLDTLFSFLKSHQKNKCIVFFSACKQVRFAYEAFKRLKLGSQILELHGRQKQSKRTAIYFEFVERKNAVLFCTDIASRGIDFPQVDWVLQYDCPEDVYTYIHRVGRTARYKSKGNSLLFLTPTEQAFVQKIDKRGIQLKKLNANPNHQLTIAPTLQKLNAENRDVKHLAEKACISYIKSVYLMKDKEVFQFVKLDTDKLAQSLGLATAPQVNFVKKSVGKNAVRTKEDGELQAPEKKLSRL
jgi:ATP-dependent RNA helicase DDX10/DBP4